MHLKDEILSDIPTKSIGKVIVLLATFTGSPRYLHQYTQDAMTYVRHGGKPTLFITFTCNPGDDVLLSFLDNNEPVYYRQDLIARIIYQKMKKLHDVLIKGTKNFIL